MMIDIVIARIALAAPRSNPKTLAVYIIANILIAGPEYKNVAAGPIPAPRLYIPAKSGKIVQLQTASKVPEIDAMLYETIFLVLLLKYLITDCLETNTATASAIKNAGISWQSYPVQPCRALSACTAKMCLHVLSKSGVHLSLLFLRQIEFPAAITRAFRRFHDTFIDFN